MTKQLTERSLRQRQDAPLKHGTYRLERRSESALEPKQLTRLLELREQLSTEPGRLEYRRDLAAFLALIVELGGNIAPRPVQGLRRERDVTR